MSGTAWKITGDYFETCNCDYLCPCIPSNLAAQPTYGHCDVALAFRIDEGNFGDVKLDGLKFVVVMHSPAAMGDGNMTVGLITDEGASEAQQQAMISIASGQAGGPMAALAPLVGTFAGAESAAIEYKQDGNSRSVEVPNLVRQGVEGYPGGNSEEPLHIGNTVHPANSTLALGRATETHFHVFGIDYDSDGGTNGHFAPFSWQGEG
jgi:hypothetical protein